MNTLNKAVQLGVIKVLKGVLWEGHLNIVEQPKKNVGIR